MNRPPASTPRSAIAAIKRLLAKHGFPLAKRSGTYSAYGSTVVITEGFQVTKVGCSRSVAVHYTHGHHHGSEAAPRISREQRAAQQDAVRTLLVDRGFTLDDSFTAGLYLRCRHHD